MKSEQSENCGHTEHGADGENQVSHSYKHKPTEGQFNFSTKNGANKGKTYFKYRKKLYGKQL